MHGQLSSTLNGLICLGAFLLLCSAPASSQIYKVCDAQGVCRYSDTPQQGSQPVVVEPVVTEFEKVVPYTPTVSNPEQESKAEVTGPPEVSVAITHPIARSTVRSNDGQFEVIWAATIKNLEGDVVYQLRLDTVPVYEGPLTQIILRDVARGERRLQVRVFDQEGREWAQSDTVDFYVQRVSVFSPARRGGGGGR